MQKITVSTCTLKVKNDKYTIYEIVDVNGLKYDSNEESKPNDIIECEIIPDPTGKGYNPKIKRNKYTASTTTSGKSFIPTVAKALFQKIQKEKQPFFAL